MNDRLVWIDCEMTGLDIERDALIEIACLVTDAELNLLDDGIDLIIKPPAEALDQMSDVVRDMHTTSGLLADLPGGVTLAEAAEAVLAYVRQHVAEPRKVPLCGNSIATDRWFIARDMPELDAFLHYRMVDVSSIKELARRWYPRVYFASPAKHGGHRALADITESVQELRVLPGSRVRPAARAGLGDSAADRREVRQRAIGPLSRSSVAFACRYTRLSRGPGGAETRSAASGPAAMVGVAQLVEHQVVVLGVAGSSPVAHPIESAGREARAGKRKGL